MDKNGKISLECTCGLVISGRTDSTNPLFTPRGSCWTNESFKLLDLPIDQDPRLNPRNRCVHEGFNSVALIPLQADNEIMGILQLNDRRPNRFSRAHLFLRRFERHYRYRFLPQTGGGRDKKGKETERFPELGARSCQ